MGRAVERPVERAVEREVRGEAHLTVLDGHRVVVGHEERLVVGILLHEEQAADGQQPSARAGVAKSVVPVGNCVGNCGTVWELGRCGCTGC